MAVYSLTSLFSTSSSLQILLLLAQSLPPILLFPPLHKCREKWWNKASWRPVLRLRFFFTRSQYSFWGSGAQVRLTGLKSSRVYSPAGVCSIPVVKLKLERASESPWRACGSTDFQSMPDSAGLGEAREAAFLSSSQEMLLVGDHTWEPLACFKSWAPMFACWTSPQS